MGEKIEMFHYKFNFTIINKWNTEARRQLQIELSVLVGFIIMFIQLFFGSFRQKSSSSIVKIVLWSANSASYVLVANTIGMMFSSIVHYELLAIWAIFLYMVLGGTDTFSAYSLEDNNNWKKQLTQQLVLGVFVSYMVCSVVDLKTKMVGYILLLFACLRHVERIVSYRIGSNSLEQRRFTKIIADHMKRVHEKNQQGQLVDATCMDGYHYIVTGDEDLTLNPGYYTIQSDLNELNMIITVEKVWKCKGILLNTVRDPESKLKDVCLSFALFKMLRRRFFGQPFVESQDQQTKDFVFKGLLTEVGDFDRAFRVIEVELSFLYDYFFTKYAFINMFEGFTLIITLIIIVGNGLLIGLLVMKGIFLESIITIFFVALFIIFEISQIFIYLKSDWAKVSIISRYTAKPQWQDNPWVEGALGVLCRLPSGKHWQNRLGQYSLLQSFSYRPKCNAVTHYLTCHLIDKKRKGQKEPWFVDIPGSLKREIISALKLIDGNMQMKNGLSSLDRNDISTNLSRRCSLQSDTQTILIWHVATILCEIHTINPQHPIVDQIKVASYLSNYCGYLVAFAPELLPDKMYDSEYIFDSAVKEAKDCLGRTRSKEETYNILIEVGDVSSNNTVLKGAGLAKELIHILDEPTRWKVLAEFWAEMILYITPSDNVTDHLNHLTKGGEFITHLWALLSHAGILERPPKTDRAGTEAP